MKEVRLGLVGVGNMGSVHARQVLSGAIPGLKLTALADLNPAKLEAFPGLEHFTDSRKLIRSGTVDAVLVATPHYDHTTIGIDALENGLHLLVEKPISVHKADAERLIAAHKNKKQVFAAMFNQRTDPFYIKLKQLIDSGELGTVRRINWIITNWFRTQTYYNSGGWRATWAGEGGGVLLNQCPHNIDLFQWLFGMPARVRAFCQIGRFHDIEVEDSVSAYFEYPSGTTGVFITSTGEAPGTNRLEVAADRGKVVIENDRFEFIRNEVPADVFCQTSKESFATPPTWQVTIPVKGHGEQHNGILKNFARAILHGEPLIAPAREGIHSVELANAMLMSSFTGKIIDLPMNAAAYARLLKQKIAGSKQKKKAVQEGAAGDFSKSFANL
ncbi:MAG: Gfo/Idh/MocA family oxidoreductase [Candidatus Methylacidiphilales bacterium]